MHLEAPIFNFNCEHVLFVFIVKQKQTKNFADFIKRFRGFSKFSKLLFVRGKFLKIQSSINHPWCHVRSHKKLGPIGLAVLTFIGFKQTNTQTNKVYIDIEQKSEIY